VTHSEQIKDIATALAKAQAEIEGAKKDSTNPHFKSSYADLASVWDACRKALTGNGLSVVQGPVSDEGRVGVTTMLMHSSGQWLESTFFMRPTKDDPQGAGSALTYARRYALAAMVGVAPEDDDGNAASEKPSGKPVAVAQQAPKGYADWLTDLEAVADEGTQALQKSWKASDVALRDHLTKTNNKAWEVIKARAAKVPATVTA
jgi:hypothetical protein